MSEKKNYWICEECGKPLLPGHSIMHVAYGTINEDGDPEVGDHYYVHADCKNPEGEE